MKSPGFSMLEIVIVMAVSTIIMTCLFEIYNQTSRNMQRVQRFVFQDSQIITLQTRFQKDVAGLSSIWFKQAELENLQAQKEKKSVSKELKKRSFYFYSVNKNQQLDTLTFLTTNPLQSYDKLTDRFVRVVYTLQPDPANQNLYRLMRKEISPATEYIDEKSLQLGKSYELLTGIKSLELSYHLVDRVVLNKQFRAEKKKEGEQEKKEELAPIVRLVKEWQPAESVEKSVEKKISSDDQADKENKAEDLGGAPVPKFIEMKITFGQTSQQKEQTYTLGFSIPSTVDNAPKSIFAIRSAIKK